ncbi:MAG: MraY family glycosyltransferase [Casimicrobiaceae bacterium]
MQLDVIWPAIACFAIASAVLPLVRRIHRFGRDGNFDRPQAFHTHTPSRLGGLVMVLSMGLTALLLLAAGRRAVFSVAPLVLAAAPVLIAGLTEDISARVRPRYRLAAALLSAILGSAIAGGIVPRTGIDIFDHALSYAPLALVTTWFMVVGACNAVNIIDGTNGLAGGVSLMMFVGLAVAAMQGGDRLSAIESLLISAAILAFLLWNFPYGRIFLGDGGAYFLGFLYAELAIQVVAHQPGLSPWFVVVLAAYPIVETIASIARRVLIHKLPLTAADALHLHSMLCRALAGGQRTARSEPRLPPNPGATVRMWFHGAFGLIVALAFRHSTPKLLEALGGYAALYLLHYAIARRQLLGKRYLAAPAAVPADPDDSVRAN